MYLEAASHLEMQDHNESMEGLSGRVVEDIEWRFF